MQDAYPLAGVSLQSQISQVTEQNVEPIGGNRYRVTYTRETKQLWTDGGHGRVNYDFECVYEGDVNIQTREGGAEAISGTLWVNGMRVGAFQN